MQIQTNIGMTLHYLSNTAEPISQADTNAIAKSTLIEQLHLLNQGQVAQLIRSLNTIQNTLQDELLNTIQILRVKS